MVSAAPALAPAEPPPPPSRRPGAPTAAAAPAAAGARTITGARFAPPRPIPARLAGLNPGGRPIARPLLTRPRPWHLLPNGCLFLHTAQGGRGLQTQHRRACVREGAGPRAALGLSPRLQPDERRAGPMREDGWRSSASENIAREQGRRAAVNDGRVSQWVGRPEATVAFPRVLGSRSAACEECLGRQRRGA